MSNYFVFVDFRTWKHCDSLYDALSWLNDVGGHGRVYERLAMDVVRRMANEDHLMQRLESGVRSGRGVDDETAELARDEIERLREELTVFKGRSAGLHSRT